MSLLKTCMAAGIGIAVSVLASSAFAADCGMNTGKPATGASISIGAIVTASGVGDLSIGAKAAQAYFKCVNDNGGINGRPIDYSYEDDQTRPDKAAELAKKLVEDKKVVALIGSSSLVDCVATAQYYEQSGVISVMAAGVAPQCYNARNIATLNAGPRYGLIGAAKYAIEKLGAKHIACPQPTVPGADWACAGVEALAKKSGIQYSHFTFDQQSADNDSLIQQILQTGADTATYLGTPPTFVPFLAAAERADVGGQLKILTPSPMYNAGMPEAIGPYWNDKFWVDIEFGPVDAANADTQNYLDVMKAYDTQVDSIGQSGYLAARMVVAALLKLDPEKIDRAATTEAIQSIQDFKNDMLCAPWSFGPKDATSRLGNRAGWIAQMTDDKWKVNAGCVAVDEDLISK